MDVSRAQRQHLADTRPGCPERGEQQPTRSVAAALIIAPISSGASPSGGCQRLFAGLTECGLAAEFDSTGADVDGKAMLEPGGWRLLMIGELNIPIGR